MEIFNFRICRLAALEIGITLLELGILRGVLKFRREILGFGTVEKRALEMEVRMSGNFGLFEVGILKIEADVLGLGNFKEKKV
ncbi:hypothetical protein K0M31_005398 [Melipona bicolor]|uniref:Uncharacterized protein n=1 Tax=Melipona bicolor TaxID=60889 RepID=A0AA40FUZ8_9HYME|nr:hypothetical protein K0M31_005398 [Melipona bicolor]